MIADETEFCTWQKYGQLEIRVVTAKLFKFHVFTQFYSFFNSLIFIFYVQFIYISSLYARVIRHELFFFFFTKLDVVALIILFFIFHVEFIYILIRFQYLSKLE